MSLSTLESKRNLLQDQPPPSNSPAQKLEPDSEQYLTDLYGRFSPQLAASPSPKRSIAVYMDASGATARAEICSTPGRSARFNVLDRVSNPKTLNTVPCYLDADAVLYGANQANAVRIEMEDANIFMYGANAFKFAGMVDVRRAATVFVDTGALTELEKLYVFEDRRAVSAFIVEHRLRGLLTAALKPLNEAFGDESIKTLKIVTDDEGAQTLFCLVLVEASIEEARWSLAAFDERWWLARCATVDGKLNFDFEFV